MCPRKWEARQHSMGLSLWVFLLSHLRNPVGSDSGPDAVCGPYKDGDRQQDSSLTQSDITQITLGVTYLFIAWLIVKSAHFERLAFDWKVLRALWPSCLRVLSTQVLCGPWVKEQLLLGDCFLWVGQDHCHLKSDSLVDKTCEYSCREGGDMRIFGTC